MSVKEWCNVCHLFYCENSDDHFSYITDEVRYAVSACVSVSMFEFNVYCNASSGKYTGLYMKSYLIPISYAVMCKTGWKLKLGAKHR